ncbi:hypothetical protein GQ53DRAFT_86861 [Thozetella sp. PMI_491]|nr:hypothetical protein GQ53DRAFT_86861 [Thozetella sp. PMI_491]
MMKYFIATPTRLGQPGLSLETVTLSVEKLSALRSIDNRLIVSFKFLFPDNGRFFLLGDRKLGFCCTFCPSCTPEVGDEVWVLFGCPMPILLRPVGERHSHRYAAVGCAFIPGLMDGEACVGLGDGGLCVRRDGRSVRDIELV